MPKTVILFGHTDGHGIAMTAISEKNLIDEGYDVTTECKYVKCNPATCEAPDECGTGVVEFFWCYTFQRYDYSHLQPGDLVVIVDIPLPIQHELPFPVACLAVKKIKELSERCIRVIIVDHHKRSMTHYGEAIQNGAEVVFCAGTEKYCHYGRPRKDMFMWGKVGAICDRDYTMRPVEEEEIEPFARLEKYAGWLHATRSNIPTVMLTMQRGCIPEIRNGNNQTVQPKSKKCREVSLIDEGLDYNERFKQLEKACEIKETPYGVGVCNEGTVTVIKNWKEKSLLPLVFKLPRNIRWKGHDDALFVKVDPPKAAHKFADEIIQILNSPRIDETAVPSSEHEFFDYILKLFGRVDIPEYLTKHAWGHVENVLANAQLLGMLSNLTSREQKILNWGALFHDIGNAAASPEFSELFQDDKIRENPRREHEKHTDTILEHWKQKGYFTGIIEEKELEIIRDICLGHRNDPNTIPHDEPNRKLCVLLRIADALDRTKDRARINDKEIKHSELMERELLDDEAQKHWNSQRAIDAIRVDAKREKIVFEFIVTDRKEANFTLENFEKELDNLKGIGVIPDPEIRVVEIDDWWY
ncbi:MAG: HD domain protein [Thermotogae bacterium ADurb.Bin062]|nr:MAG: HD domain protein [Thermotogota bacterium ADurb.Bin062]